MPLAMCHFTPKVGVEPEACIAAIHAFAERLADLGLIYTWQVTRTRPLPSADDPRGFVVTIDTPHFSRAQDAFDATHSEAADLRADLLA